MDRPDDVLSFWFPAVTPGDPAAMARQLEWWFRGGTDAEINRRFRPLHEEAVELAEQLARDAAPDRRTRLEHSASQARGHHDVVARFGRQPHRNAVLVRTSPAEEIEYLARGEFVHERPPPRQGDTVRLS